LGEQSFPGQCRKQARTKKRPGAAEQRLFRGVGAGGKGRKTEFENETNFHTLLFKASSGELAG
jgi:hypothetical protein